MATEATSVISIRNWRILSNVIPRYINQNINVEGAIRLLFQRGYISEDDKQKLKLVCRLEYNNVEKKRNLLTELLRIMDLNDIIRFLRDINQHSFANDLLKEQYSQGIIIPSNRADMAVRPGTFKYYNNLKSQMDNNCFHDRINELMRRSVILKGLIATERNLTKRQCFVDRYAVVRYMTVAQYRDREDRVKILEEMKDALPPDVDGTFTNILYLCKMAVTEMHAGNEETAWNYQRGAIRQCDGCQQTFVKAFLFHDLQFISRIIHSCSHADKHLKDTISGGDLGLLFMQEEMDDTAKIWNRVFLSENSMGLLKIRSNFEVLVEETVDEISIRHAEKLLDHLLNRQGPLELRREMIYYLCQARISELKEETEDAKKYATKSKELAEDGVHFENDKTNIEEYHRYLCSKKKLK